MKIIDQSESIQDVPSGYFSRQFSRINLTSRHPTSNALTILSSNLEKFLDDHHVLLRNIKLLKPHLLIPAILVGPAGLLLFYPTDTEGVFRAHGEMWEQLKKRGQTYVQARPNLLVLVQGMADAVAGHLVEQQVDCRKIEPILFLANPGIHIDTNRPAVKMILPDTLDRFIGGLLKAEVVLDRDTIRKIINALLMDATNIDTAEVYDVQDEFAFKDLPATKPDRWKTFSDLPRDEPVITQKVPFTRHQWFMLMLLIFTNIIILTTLVVVVLTGG
ncbi:MAG: hypothetical protein A2Z16_08845 [Chloroflexi bacterium RBG_16_54_18]|nr:MAG: hypothetical protein A2Z16_08845 [Chloroflexi bacterium RBG_16_54_18]